MSTPAVSVLLPCRNAAPTLDEALRSIAGQSLSDFELIAIDDGSTDGTAERLTAWAVQDPRLRLLRIEARGIIAALNAGLAACQAPVIARMDADDIAEPDRLLQQLDLLRARPDLAAVGCLVAGYPPDLLAEGFRLYIEWQNRLIEPAAIAREIFIESPLVHSSMVIRREWLERVGGYQERGWAEDYDLWLRMHLAGARFAKVPAVLLALARSPAPPDAHRPSLLGRELSAGQEPLPAAGPTAGARGGLRLGGGADGPAPGQASAARRRAADGLH